jgi:hypothetical protein
MVSCSKYCFFGRFQALFWAFSPQHTEANTHIIRICIHPYIRIWQPYIYIYKHIYVQHIHISKHIHIRIHTPQYNITQHLVTGAYMTPSSLNFDAIQGLEKKVKATGPGSESRGCRMSSSSGRASSSSCRVIGRGGRVIGKGGRVIGKGGRVIGKGGRVCRV